MSGPEAWLIFRLLSGLAVARCELKIRALCTDHPKTGHWNSLTSCRSECSERHESADNAALW